MELCQVTISNLLIQIENDNIVNHKVFILSYFVVHNFHFLMMINENILCFQGGDVLEVVQRGGLDTNAARHFCWQITCGLRHLHQRGYIHRDIKLENMFISEPVDVNNYETAVVKLGDYGCVIPLLGCEGTKKTN